jgi:hypothetical protein
MSTALSFTFDSAVPPLIPSNDSFRSAYVEYFQIGQVQANDVFADLFTDGVAIWTGGEMTDMSKISGLLFPVDPSDAASKAYVDASVGGNPGGNNSTVQFNDGGIFGGDDAFKWNQTSNILTVTGKITGLVTLDIVNPTDAVNKAYVDAASGNPGGASTNVQFNNGGNFDGTNDLTWNGTIFNVVGTVNATNVVGTAVSGVTITGLTITDTDGVSPDFITISGGALIGSGTTSVTATEISDGAGSTMTTGVVTATTFTDNIATLTGGVLTDVTDISFLDDDVTPTTINMGENLGSTDGLGTITGLKTLTGASSYSSAANKAYVDAAVGSAPGLPSKGIQFNSDPSGVFTGSNNFVFDTLTNSMTLTSVFLPNITPTATLTVSGTITDGTASLLAGALSGVTTIDASGVVTLTNASVSTLSTNGALVVTGGVGIGGDVNVVGDCFANEFNAVSDIRLKENIVPLDGSLDKLAEIGCYSYNMIGSDRTAYGVLAQQLEEVGLNDIVKETPHHKTVNYLQFIALLIDGMNELRDEVTELKRFKMASIHGSLHEKYAPVKAVVDNFKTIKKVSRSKNTNVSDRKRYDGLTYKYCFDCSEWTVLENFSRDSKAPDCYKRSCKKH